MHFVHCFDCMEIAHLKTLTLPHVAPAVVPTRCAPILDYLSSGFLSSPLMPLLNNQQTDDFSKLLRSMARIHRSEENTTRFSFIIPNGCYLVQMAVIWTSNSFLLLLLLLLLHPPPFDIFFSTSFSNLF